MDGQGEPADTAGDRVETGRNLADGLGADVGQYGDVTLGVGAGVVVGALGVETQYPFSIAALHKVDHVAGLGDLVSRIVARERDGTGRLAQDAQGDDEAGLVRMSERKGVTDMKKVSGRRLT